MIRRLTYYLAFIIATSLVLNSCKKDDPEPPVEPEPDPTSFENDVQPILNAHCNYGGCHDFYEEAGQLDLTADVSHSELVNVDAFLFDGQKRVIPSDTVNSVLVKLIKGLETPAMPLNQQGLPDHKIHTITKWISEGALDN